VGDRWGIAGLLEVLAELTCEACERRGDQEAGGTGQAFPAPATADLSRAAPRGARLFGAAEALREVIGIPLHAGEQGSHDHDLHWLREVLGDEALAAGWAEGRAMPLEEAVAYALEAPVDPP